MTTDEQTTTTLLDRINAYRKAIAALLVPSLALLIVALTPGSDAGATISAGEWIGALVAGLTGGYAVAEIPNRPLK